MLLKDLLSGYAGKPLTSGSRLYQHYIADTDAELVRRYKSAGLIIVAKTNLSEFGIMPVTEPDLFGPCRNPWDLRRTPGGSSGGAAASVAAGIVPVAHGGDGGGSIRIPASCCGLFGLKPTRGRNPSGPDASEHWMGFAAEHVLTRSVRDSAAFFAATEDAGPHAQRPPVGFVAGPAKRRLRIGVLLENGLGQRPAPEVVAALDATVKLLAGLGHHLDETHLPYDGGLFIDDFLALWAQGAQSLADNIGRHLGRPADGRELEPFSLGLADMARRMTGPQLAAAGARLNADALAYDTWFPAHQFDLVVSPVLSSGPPLLGEVGPSVPFDTLVARLKAYVGYTPIHNIAGAPSMSVPLYWTPDGLPVGTMLSARAGNERTLFELAYELEAARPWAHRIPPVHA